MANPSNGGAFVPGNDYTVTGLWTFTTDPVFPSSGAGPILTNPTIAGTVSGSATYTTPTLTTPVISTGLTASGSAANDFSGSTGTFKTSTGAVTLGSGAISVTGAVTFAANVNESVAAGTSAFDWSAGTGVFKSSTGANQLSGAVTISDVTTPSLTTAAGKTNTGFVLINGKTSGSTKLITADATAQAVVISTAAQTVGGSTLTIPDQAGVSSNFVFTTLAQTLTNKTLTAPVIGVATGTSLAVSGLLTSSSPTAGIGYATGAGGTGTQSTDKTTTVTLTPSAVLCGAVTTNNATLNAATIVTFSVTDTAVAATDTIVINHISGGTLGSYTVNAHAAAGSFAVNLRNNTAGNLSEALVLQFAVIKAVNA